MNPEAELTTPATERVFDLLAAHDPTQALAGAEGDLETRALVEALGLLSYAEPPADVDPAIRAAVLARISTGAARETASATGATVVPLRSRAPQPWRRVSGLLAAALGVCVVGLAYLGGQLGEQRATVAKLTAQQAANDRTEAHSEAIQAAIARLEARQQALEMVTKVARQAYPMHPAGAAPAALDDPESPRGLVFVCGHHQRWYLNVHGLEPAPRGFRYSLWFQTDHGPVHAGFIDIEPRQPGELAAPTMPDGTRSFMLTLEPSGATDAAPHGEAVMIAGDAVRL